MRVWLVFKESGEYEQYSRDMTGVFADEAVARKWAEQIGGEVEEHEVLQSDPVPVTHHDWRDRIMADGSIWPARPAYWRQEWPSWKHLESPAKGEIAPWEPDSLFVEVGGYDRSAVEAEHARLVAEARARLGVVELTEAGT